MYNIIFHIKFFQREETSNTRTRRGKRPHYNEDSEESNGMHTRRKRRNVTVNNESDSNEADNSISISSRGRIRKLTAKVKAYLRE